MAILPVILALNTLGALRSLVPAPAEVSIGPSDVLYIETRWPETVLRSRPWIPARRLATVNEGTRLAVRGSVESRDEGGCHGKPWYAVHPFGFVCSEHARPTDEPPDLRPALPVDEGERLPFRYVTVRADGTPSYASVEDLRAGIVDAELTKGMSLSIDRVVNVDGLQYLVTTENKVIPKDGAGWLGQGSDWQGVAIDYQRDRPGPMFAWSLGSKVAVRQAPDSEAPVVRTLELRARVDLLESRDHEGRPQWWRIADGWVEARSLNEAIAIEPPPTVLSQQKRGPDEPWIDVDTGEQVLVAYRGRKPVYATLVASGRGFPTPKGNYPYWAKVASMDMANQEYEDNPYRVEDVPWVVLFQGHNALHGAYWHNRFGHRKSHGCVNLAPLDARWVFHWVPPDLPRGWTGFLPDSGGHSVVVHVRDSSAAPGQEFTQERPMGPPDPEEEKRKLEEAEERRAQAEAEAAAQAIETADPFEFSGMPFLIGTPQEDGANPVPDALPPPPRPAPRPDADDDATIELDP